MKYPELRDILKVHEMLLKKYGGPTGTRDKGLLESAVQRPKSSVFGEDAYPSLFNKAAALCHSLLFNHPFVDGNKRVAFAACHLTLMANGWNLTTSSELTYHFLVDCIKKQSDWREISAWLKKHSKKI